MKHARDSHPPSGLILEKYRTEIDRCVKCGACRAVCPPSLHQRSESASARGRMVLIKAVLNKQLPVSPTFKDRLATCTACLACEVSCPSGVPVTEILQAGKEQAVEEAGAGIIGTAVVAFLKRDVLKSLARLAPLALHYRGTSVKGGHPGASRSEAGDFKQGKRAKAEKRNRRGAVIFFPGCAINYFQPEIGAAAGKLLAAIGYDIIVPENLKCCGRPLLSLGDRRAAQEFAARNCVLFSRVDADAVVTACASCGLTFKREYPKLLAPGITMPPVLDIHEFLATRLEDMTFAPMQRSVTIHDPCHLGRGQGLSSIVRALLLRVPGLTLKEMDNSDRCCGFGGVMRITHPALSNRIGEEKAENIIATGASTVAAGCPGCRMQISDALRRAGADARVVHPVQILEEAITKTRKDEE